MSDKDIDAGLVLHRLNSIDKTLAGVSQSLERLVLVEERQAQTNAALERAFKVLDKQEGRVTALEQQAVFNTRASGWVEKALMACAGGIGTLLIGFVMKKGGM